MNNIIICVSCRTKLPRNINNDTFDCYCPVCGLMMAVTGNDVKPYNSQLDGITACENKQLETLDSYLKMRDWHKARRIANALLSETKENDYENLVKELDYHIHIEEAELCRAYKILLELVNEDKLTVETRSSYMLQLDGFNSLAGVNSFNKYEISELINCCIPDNADSTDYAEYFCSSAMFLSGVAKRLDLKVVNVFVKADIIYYALENDLNLFFNLPGAYLETLIHSSKYDGRRVTMILLAPLTVLLFLWIYVFLR